MRRVALLAVLVAIVAVPTTASAAIEGVSTVTLSRTISGKADLDGRWTLRLTNGFSRYTIRLDGTVVARGRLTRSGSRLTFRDTSGPGRCPSSGTYTYSTNPSAGTFRFRKVTDSCAGRVAVLPGTWRVAATTR